MGLELRAYCDESYVLHEDLVLSGLVAPAASWLWFEQEWGNVLANANPPLAEFHMQACEQGLGEFKGRQDRLELKNKFFSIIRNADIDGYAVRIDLVAFREVQERLSAKVTQPEFNKPFLHGFAALLLFMTNLVAHQPKGERIAFVFDRQDEWAGRVLETFNAHVDGRAKGALDRDRLGSLTFADSKLIRPLQGADTLAYRVRRDLASAAPVELPTVSRHSDWPRVRIAQLGSTTVDDLMGPGRSG